MIKRSTFALVVPAGATICTFGSVAAFIVLRFLMNAGVSGKQLIFEFLIAMLIFGVGSLLCSFSFISLRLFYSTETLSRRILGTSLLPPLILFGGVWIEDDLSGLPGDSAAPVIFGCSALLMAFALEFAICRHLLRPYRAPNHDGSNFGTRGIGRTVALIVVAISILVAVQVLLEAGRGSILGDSPSFSGLLVLVPLRLLTARKICTYADAESRT